MQAAVRLLALLAGVAGVLVVALLHLDVASDVEGVGSDFDTVVHSVGGSALVLAADAIDVVEAVGDLLLVGLSGCARATVVVLQLAGTADRGASGQVAVAVELVDVASGLGADATDEAEASAVAGGVLNALNDVVTAEALLDLLEESGVLRVERFLVEGGHVGVHGQADGRGGGSEKGDDGEFHW